MGPNAPEPAIQLRGVRVHNLQNVDVDLPRGKLIAICGVSGSGKTSLAIDTLYAEGQRRYIESFSAYTRQFLQRLDKPDYDRIDGLPPALAVTRSGAPRGNRSTVGTASETLDYLRLFFAKVAQPYCYQCGRPLMRYTPQAVARLIAELPRGSKLMVAIRASWEDVADRATVFADLQAAGFVRFLAGERLLNLGQDERQTLADALPTRGEVWTIVDRLRGGDDAARTTESLEMAFEHGEGEIALLLDASDDALLAQAAEQLPVELLPTASSRPAMEDTAWSAARFSRQLRCTLCHIDYPDPEPRLFNFNSPLGACPTCEGFGQTIDLDLDLVAPDKRKSLRDGALAPWNTP
ncbi:MAG: hypothetical protein KDA45_02300, partial [Planctomycetales bacterium]|nr:hypothetical protein [Planctomycetales bacterium]